MDEKDERDRRKRSGERNCNGTKIDESNKEVKKGRETSAGLSISPLSSVSLFLHPCTPTAMVEKDRASSREQHHHLHLNNTTPGQYANELPNDCRHLGTAN